MAELQTMNASRALRIYGLLNLSIGVVLLLVAWWPHGIYSEVIGAYLPFAAALELAIGLASTTGRAFGAGTLRVFNWVISVLLLVPFAALILNVPFASISEPRQQTSPAETGVVAAALALLVISEFAFRRIPRAPASAGAREGAS